MPKDMTSSQDTLRVSIGQYSSAGRKGVNQDFHGAMVPSGRALKTKGIVLAVADGISSSPVSREAAETAVRYLLTDYYATADSWSVRTAGTRVLEAANAWLHGQNVAVGDINSGHICTLSALILKGGEGHVLHVGDSRVSRLSGGSLEPLTRDHRVVLAAGESHLERALGAHPTLEIDYRSVALSPGDIFVLTTDGVHEHLSARALREALGQPDLYTIARELAEAALEAGSEDNLTVQIVRIDALGASDAEQALNTASLPIPRLPNPGDEIDGFRIVRNIHVTARSHVFMAIDPAGRKVALKIPTRESAEDESYRRRFALEEWIARRVTSPHIVAAAPVPERRHALFVATEWVEGTTLRQWMTDNPRPTQDEVRAIVGQLATGLTALHRRDMMHQDLRPENVMIDTEGTVKIIDLGSTSVAGVEDAAAGVLGELPGTYQYTAPEYLSGDTVSWRSDQYALGVIAYEMLTGRLPYGAQVARVRSRADQRRLTYRTARDDASGVPEWIDEALARAVHPDPLRRYDALSEFVADLKRPSAGWTAARQKPLAQRDPVRFWQGVAAVLAVLCLILAAKLNG